MANKRGHSKGMMPVQHAKDTKTTLKRLWHYLGHEKFRLAAVSLLTVLSSVLSLIAPYLMGKSIDEYIIPGDLNGLRRICLILLGIYLLDAFMFWLQAYIMATAAQRTVHKMRSDLFSKLQKLPLNFFDSTTRGELMSRFTNDIDNISNVLNQSIIQFLSGLLTIIEPLL